MIKKRKTCISGTFGASKPSLLHNSINLWMLFVSSSKKFNKHLFISIVYGKLSLITLKTRNLGVDPYGLNWFGAHGWSPNILYILLFQISLPGAPYLLVHSQSLLTDFLILYSPVLPQHLMAYNMLNCWCAIKNLLFSLSVCTAPRLRVRPIFGLDWHHCRNCWICIISPL